MLFGPDNLGDAAINGFLQKHTCSVYCRRLGLEGQRCTKSVSEREREKMSMSTLFKYLESTVFVSKWVCDILISIYIGFSSLIMCFFFTCVNACIHMSPLCRHSEGQHLLCDKSPTTSNEDSAYRQPAN